jgi:hypothetical protein
MKPLLAWALLATYWNDVPLDQKGYIRGHIREEFQTEAACLKYAHQLQREHPKLTYTYECQGPTITVYVLMTLYFTTKGFQWDTIAVDQTNEQCEQRTTELRSEVEHNPRFSKGTAYAWECLPVKMMNPERIPNLKHAHEQLEKELNVPFEIGKPHPALGGGTVTNILRSGPQR